jgi:hypothetical protein
MSLNRFVFLRFENDYYIGCKTPTPAYIAGVFLIIKKGDFSPFGLIIYWVP